MWDLLDLVLPSPPGPPAQFSTEISLWSGLLCYSAGQTARILIDLAQPAGLELLARAGPGPGRYLLCWAAALGRAAAMVSVWRGEFGLLSNCLGESLPATLATLVTATAG